MEYPQPDVIVILKEGSSIEGILIKNPGLLIGVQTGSSGKVTVYGFSEDATPSPQLKGGLLTGTGEYKTR
nr:hypothetical protein [uncultured bacterium]AMP48420.1 hypothetical protein [uncultured bacterium]